MRKSGGLSGLYIEKFSFCGPKRAVRNRKVLGGQLTSPLLFPLK